MRLPLKSRAVKERAFKTFSGFLIGRRQVVRHRVLVPTFGGSNPSALVASKQAFVRDVTKAERLVAAFTDEWQKPLFVLTNRISYSYKPWWLTKLCTSVVAASKNAAVTVKQRKNTAEQKQSVQTHPFNLSVLCQEPDLNRWHEDFQSSALPTELSRLFLDLNIYYATIVALIYTTLFFSKKMVATKRLPKLEQMLYKACTYKALLCIQSRAL